MTVYRSFILSACVTLAPFGSLAAADVAPSPPAPATTPLSRLGEIKLGNIPVTINRRGDVSAGKSLQLEFLIPGDTPRPLVLTTWAGSSSNPAKAGEPIDKVHAMATASGRLTATIRLPATMDAASVLWISIEPADGKTVIGTLPLLQLQ